MHAHLSNPISHPASASVAAIAECLLEPLSGDAGIRRLTLWADPAEARAELERTGGGQLYEVEDLLGQPARGSVPAVAGLTEFDGPRDAEQQAADRRSSRERVWPAASQVPGTIGALSLRAADGALAVVALADSPATLEAANQTILSTPLLPGEDPARLGGPDRQSVFRITERGLSALLADTAAHPEQVR